MKIAFITLSDMSDIESRGIYPDLMRYFAQKGHEVYIVSPSERRTGNQTQLIRRENCTVLKVKTGNIQKTNLIEKGISTVLLERQLISAIKKYLSDVRFELVLYSTPPVTIAGVVEYIKKRDKATSYLMLKDIFPQNAVDLKMFKKNGIIYNFFRRKEQKLYQISDHIGCTSPENIRFNNRDNENRFKDKLEICVNCMEPYGTLPSEEQVKAIREKYDLPCDKKIFLYGGNLGKPQGIDFLMKCLDKTKELEEAYFLIIGNGTEESRLREYISNRHFENVRLMPFQPKEDFDRIAAACDVGMIFLNYLTTTPNTPSRLLSYTNAALPVLAVTDSCTDVGSIIEEGGFGWHCLSNDVDSYYEIILKILQIKDFGLLKQNSHQYLLDHYTPEAAYSSIINHFEVKEYERV